MDNDLGGVMRLGAYYLYRPVKRAVTLTLD